MKNTVDKCLDWLERNMLSFDRGCWGIYERIRTDVNQRVPLCRPDTATECLRVLHAYKKTYRTERMQDVYENVVRWLEYAQNTMSDDKNTAFPFYLTDGYKGYSRGIPTLYQNDNGKIIINLAILYSETSDVRFLDMAKKSADWWLSIQKEEGYYHDPLCINPQGRADTPCMHLWMMAAMIILGKISNEEKYIQSGYKAFQRAKTYIVDGGRIITSYEKNRAEDWRPISSENYIALLCFALCYQYTGDAEFLGAIEKIEKFCESLLDECGAILNFTPQTKHTALNISENLTDLVYTLGFALNALARLAVIYPEKWYKNSAKKLASFLAKIQCNENDPRVDGAWRGAYNIKTNRYDGRCNQNNEIDEGGEFSVYAGWCALPILMGMMKVESLDRF